LCLSGQSDLDTLKYTTSCYYYCDNGDHYEMETETIQEMIDIIREDFSDHEIRLKRLFRY